METVSVELTLTTPSHSTGRLGDEVLTQGRVLLILAAIGIQSQRELERAGRKLKTIIANPDVRAQACSSSAQGTEAEVVDSEGDERLRL